MRGIWIKNTVLLLGMSMTGAELFAQQTTTPPPETTAQSAAPTTGAAKLTQEQKNQLMDMRMNAHDQAAIIRNDQTLTPEQKQAKLKDLRASTHQQMKTVLTPEQQAALANRRTAAKERFAAKLGLTVDQQSKMKALFESTHQQRQTVLQNASLNNDQKMAQLKQIRQTTKAQLATILTPDQMTKMEQMRKGHRHGKLG